MITIQSAQLWLYIKLSNNPRIAWVAWQNLCWTVYAMMVLRSAALLRWPVTS